MYDRYTITLNHNELTLILGVEVPKYYEPNYNAAPTKILPVITSEKDRELSFFHWGLMPRWSNNKTISPKLFNLPLDSVLNKTIYRRKLQTHRCVIPMDGFYVWKQVSRKQIVPYYFYYPDRRVFSIAGLWEEYDDADAASHSFIMITKKATSLLFTLQDDMPAILDAASTRKWLESDDFGDVEELFDSASTETLISHTVSPRIRELNSNDVSLTYPAPASDQYGNFTLFT